MSSQRRGTSPTGGRRGANAPRAAVFMGGGTARKKNDAEDLPADIAVLDSVVGRGTGAASDALLLQQQRQQQQQQTQRGGGAHVPAGALVDFASVAEAPAFFDLPIPLYISSGPAKGGGAGGNLVSSPQRPPQDGGGGGAGFFSDDLNASDGSFFQRQQQLQMQEQAAQQHTSKFLQPMSSDEFKLNAQLMQLDTSPGGQIDREAQYMQRVRAGLVDEYDGGARGPRSGRRRIGGGGGGSNVGGATRRGGGNNGGNGKGGAGGGGGGGQYASQLKQESARIVLPKAIADMVASLRPTHYAPLRKAMRTRSQERFYEGDEKEPDEQARAEMQADEERKQAAIQRNVTQWQTTAGGSNSLGAPLLQLPAPPNDGRASSQASQHRFVPSAGEPAPRMPQQGATAPHPHASDSRLSPLSTIHAGRRPSINLAPMIGDLGVPSRGPLPTHGRVQLHEAEDNSELDRYAEVMLTVDPATGLILQHEQESRLSEPLNLLSSASPSRLAGTRSRQSVSVAAQEQSENQRKTQEFHRDLLAWYRTEATMLRVAQ